MTKAVKRPAIRKKAPVKASAPRTDVYNPQELDPRWQARWEKDGLHRAVIDEQRPKHYALTMLPYTSGDLHFGHWYPMGPSDAPASSA